MRILRRRMSCRSIHNHFSCRGSIYVTGGKKLFGGIMQHRYLKGYSPSLGIQYNYLDKKLYTV